MALVFLQGSTHVTLYKTLDFCKNLLFLRLWFSLSCIMENAATAPQ
jgi:hypothetical protein